MVDFVAATNLQVGGNIWNAAYWTTNGGTSLIWPQTFLPELITASASLFTKLAGGSDMLVPVDDRTCFAGRCTQAVISNIVKSYNLVPPTRAFGGAIFRYYVEVLSIASAYPLIGSELTKAVLFGYMANGDTRAKFYINIDEPTFLESTIDELLMQTMQIDGTFMRQMAIGKQKKDKGKVVEVAGLGSVTGKADNISHEVMEGILSDAAQVFRQASASATDWLITKGKEAAVSLKSGGFAMVKDIAMSAIGTAIFA